MRAAGGESRHLVPSACLARAVTVFLRVFHARRVSDAELTPRLLGVLGEVAVRSQLRYPWSSLKPLVTAGIRRVLFDPRAWARPEGAAAPERQPGLFAGFASAGGAPNGEVAATAAGDGSADVSDEAPELLGGEREGDAARASMDLDGEPVDAAASLDGEPAGSVGPVASLAVLKAEIKAEVKSEIGDELKAVMREALASKSPGVGASDAGETASQVPLKRESPVEGGVDGSIDASPPAKRHAKGAKPDDGDDERAADADAEAKEARPTRPGPGEAAKERAKEGARAATERGEKKDGADAEAERDEAEDGSSVADKEGTKDGIGGAEESAERAEAAAEAATAGEGRLETEAQASREPPAETATDVPGAPASLSSSDAPSASPSLSPTHSPGKPTVSAQADAASRSPPAPASRADSGPVSPFSGALAAPLPAPPPVPLPVLSSTPLATLPISSVALVPLPLPAPAPVPSGGILALPVPVPPRAPGSSASFPASPADAEALAFGAASTANPSSAKHAVSSAPAAVASAEAHTPAAEQQSRALHPLPAPPSETHVPAPSPMPHTSSAPSPSAPAASSSPAVCSPSAPAASSSSASPSPLEHSVPSLPEPWTQTSTGESLDDLAADALQLVLWRSDAPFTFPRLCELLVNPWPQYRGPLQLAPALRKLLVVTTALERRKRRGRRGHAKKKGRDKPAEGPTAEESVCECSTASGISETLDADDTVETSHAAGGQNAPEAAGGASVAPRHDAADGSIDANDADRPAGAVGTASLQPTISATPSSPLPVEGTADDGSERASGGGRVQMSEAVAEGGGVGTSCPDEAQGDADADADARDRPADEVGADGDRSPSPPEASSDESLERGCDERRREDDAEMVDRDDRDVGNVCEAASSIRDATMCNGDEAPADASGERVGAGDPEGASLRENPRSASTAPLEDDGGSEGPSDAAARLGPDPPQPSTVGELASSHLSRPLSGHLQHRHHRRHHHPHHGSAFSCLGPRPRARDVLRDANATPAGGPFPGRGNEPCGIVRLRAPERGSGSDAVMSDDFED